MSIEVNGVGGQQQSAVSAVSISQQDKEVYASIYNMLQKDDADKNENFLLDAKDFKDNALLDFAKSKGLIGRTLETALNYVEGVIKTKKESVIEIKKDSFNEKTGEYYDSAIQDGREVSRTYYKTDENGQKVVDEIINLEYDENGKVYRKIYMDQNGNVKDLVLVSPEDETKVLQRTEYDEKGFWTKQGIYENGELVKINTIKREKDMWGQTRIIQETYTKNGDSWEVKTSKGIESKLTPGEPYITYEPNKD